jgi:hypothetical protein
LPIIGNMLDWPNQKEWETFGRWKEQYGNVVLGLCTIVLLLTQITAGDIVSVSTLGQTMIIVNSFPVADALLNRKGSVFSSRPQPTMAFDLVGWGRPLTLRPMNDGLRIARAILHKGIGTFSSFEQYFPLIETCTRKCMASILSEPHAIAKYARQYVRLLIYWRMLTVIHPVVQGPSF